MIVQIWFATCFLRMMPYCVYKMEQIDTYQHIVAMAA